MQELLYAIETETESENINELLSAGESIRNRYLNNRHTGESLVNTDTLTSAYAIMRMPACYSAVRSALSHSIELTDDIPRSLTDVGSGTGAVLWACDSLINMKSATLYEREDSMAKLGKAIASNGSDFINNAVWNKLDLTSDDEIKTSELVTASYVLNELKEEYLLPVAKKLFNATEKMLLIVEPGTPECFREIKLLRDYFISIGGYILAPCTHDTECALKADDWCHFTVRVQRTALQKKLKNAEVPFEDEKFCYIAVLKKKPEKEGRAKHRILRHPDIKQGHINLCICEKDGVRNITVSKKDKEPYKQARKANAGDSIDLG